MADIAEQFLEGASLVLTMGKWIALGILGGIVIGGGAWFYYRRKAYSNKPEIWGTSGGIPDVIAHDRAKGIRIQAKSGVASLLHFKKLKRYVKMPSRDFFNKKKVRFWFRKDGELTPVKPIKIHFYDFGKKLEKKKEEIIKEAEENSEVFIPLVMEDVSRKFAVMQVKFIDEDMRLTYVAVNKIIRDTFSFKKFWEKYGNAIMAILMVLVFGVVILLILDGMQGYIGTSDIVAEKLVKLTETVDSWMKTQGGAIKEAIIKPVEG